MCTRVVYLGDADRVITGRSMDWKYEIGTNLYAFHRGMQRHGEAGRGSPEWTAKYGSVVATGYDIRTNRAADRFVRASFYIDAVPKTADPLEAAAVVFSVVRNASVPFGISTPDQPNISSTRWRTVIDHKAKRYFFESALSPSVFWVELTNLDFSEGGTVRRLDLGEGEKTIYSGDASGNFQPAEPFTFLAVS
jgi:choloylglycine hydrolase